MTHDDTATESCTPAAGYVAGDSVEICDGSEAHGDKGRVMQVQDDGLIIVELEAGCVWPVTKNELKLFPPQPGIKQQH